jgi:hypothetical protein
MLSLVPELKKVPDAMKLDIKTDLINVFKRARLQHPAPAFDHIHTVSMYLLPTHLSNVVYTPWQISQQNHEMLFIHQLPCDHPLQPLITVLLHQILIFLDFSDDTTRQ